MGPLGTWGINRTYDNCCEHAKLSTVEERKGCKHAPLLEISFEKVIPDTLHLFVRLSEMLINNLACWAVDNKRTQEMSDAAFAAGVNFFFREVKVGGTSAMKWSELDALESEKTIEMPEPGCCHG